MPGPVAGAWGGDQVGTESGLLDLTLRGGGGGDLGGPSTLVGVKASDLSGAQLIALTVLF